MLKVELNMAAHTRLARRYRRNVHHRVPRIFRDRSNPLEELDDDEVFERYRFRPQTIVILLGFLDLNHETLRNNPLPALLQVLLCLRFFATGALHLLIGDSLRISRSTAGRCIRRVAVTICALARRFITFPVGNEATKVKSAFGAVSGFPNVVGCVDGTFVRIQRPNKHEADFVNRKGYHSLNVQMCCGARFRITSCNASWPGSVHDSRIFRTSALCRNFEDGNYKGYLLGDSGYPCRWFLLIPLLNPNNAAEERYNYALCRTRVLIEQTFGILKRRFQCLHVELRTSPKQAVIYVTACAILHNFGIEYGDIMNNDNDNEQPEDVDDGLNTDTDGPMDGAQLRRHIISTFFVN